MPIVRIDLEANNAAWQLMAHMCLPNNCEMRENFLATQAARAKQNIKDEAPSSQGTDLYYRAAELGGEVRSTAV